VVLLTVVAAPRRFCLLLHLFLAAVARIVLVPDVLESLDAETLMKGGISRSVAVRLKPDCRMSAREDELLVVAHLLGWTGWLELWEQ
jgi:hypothetical protein